MRPCRWKLGGKHLRQREHTVPDTTSTRLQSLPVEVAVMGKWEGHGKPWADTDIVVTGFLSQRVLGVSKLLPLLR